MTNEVDTHIVYSSIIETEGPAGIRRIFAWELSPVSRFFPFDFVEGVADISTVSPGTTSFASSLALP